MLPLQPEIRRELFDVNLFDRPEAPGLDTQQLFNPCVFFPIICLNPGGFFVTALFSPQ